MVSLLNHDPPLTLRDKLRVIGQRPPDAPCLALEGLHRPIELAGQERHQDGATVEEDVSDG